MKIYKKFEVATNSKPSAFTKVVSKL